LKTNSFETIDVRTLLKECGPQIPAIENILSLYDGQILRSARGKPIDFERDDLIVTFEGLIQNTSFIPQLREVMQILEDALHTSVDLEFASDGKNLTLLQCRTQSSMEGSEPASIPKDPPPERILFLANRFISNGRLPDITHLVYVDPQRYDALSSEAKLLAVGRAVGRLNKLLPRRRFLLMGPGRWGSRGDIKLGVKVTYADISNTAALVEIAWSKGHHQPDLSFGTHFFQDLVEAQIRYMPLYPEEKGTIFQKQFLLESPNLLPQILPEFSDLADVIKVVDIPQSQGGMVLRVLMNADRDVALGIFAPPQPAYPLSPLQKETEKEKTFNHWAWRLEMAEHIAALLDGERFGVQALYLIGSTKNATAGPQSDIDLLLHFRGSKAQRRELILWLEGWSLSIDEMNFKRTGYRSGGLLDVHFITDEDIAQKTSYAIKIGAATDAARLLKLKEKT
jgi:pyruvate,water dikinase